MQLTVCPGADGLGLRVSILSLPWIKGFRQCEHLSDVSFLDSETHSPISRKVLILRLLNYYLGNSKGDSTQPPGSLKNTAEHSSEVVFLNDAPCISLDTRAPCGSPSLSGFSGVELAWSCPWPSCGAFHPGYSITIRSPAPPGNPHEDHFQGISLSSWRRFPFLTEQQIEQPTE